MAGGVTGQFADAINRKYDIQQQEATARGSLFGAQATGILSALPTENALRAAQANHTNQQAAQVAPLAQSSIAQGVAGIGETNARSGLLGAQTRGQDISNSPVSESVLRALHSSFLGSGLFGGGGGLGTPAPAAPAPAATGVAATPTATPDNVSPYSAGNISPWYSLAGDQTGDNPYAFSTGTSKVPGKGPSTVDTVPAMLAPREAVLNEHAADLIGRDKIAAANSFGNMIASALGGAGPKGQDIAEPAMEKMETRPGFAKGSDSIAAYYPRKKNPGMQPQKLAKGTHMVKPGKSDKTPTIQTLTGQPQDPGTLSTQPKALATILQMLAGIAHPARGMA